MSNEQPEPPTRSNYWVTTRGDPYRLLTALGTALAAAATGLGTLGLPPVELHGVLHHLGIMDPLCGGTRAAAFTVRGDWSRAWQYNPLGIVVVVMAAAAVLRAAVGLLFGRWLSPVVRWTPRARKLALAAVTIGLVALTVRQQLRADLLLAGAGGT